MPPSRIFDENVEVYLARLAVSGPAPHPVIREMEEEAVRRAFPIVGPEVGRFFRQIAMLTRPRRVLELGSGFGYSALWWVFGSPETEVHLTDFDGANLELARGYAERAGVADRLHFHQGDALKVAQQLRGPWDIVFCDIDKKEYPAALGFAGEVLGPGGLLLYDNMLWDGRVVMPEGEWDENTEAVVATTRAIYRDPRWAASLLPVRDGVLMAVRR